MKRVFALAILALLVLVIPAPVLCLINKANRLKGGKP